MSDEGNEGTENPEPSEPDEADAGHPDASEPDETEDGAEDQEEPEQSERSGYVVTLDEILKDAARNAQTFERLQADAKPWARNFGVTAGLSKELLEQFGSMQHRLGFMPHIDVAGLSGTSRLAKQLGQLGQFGYLGQLDFGKAAGGHIAEMFRTPGLFPGGLTHEAMANIMGLPAGGIASSIINAGFLNTLHENLTQERHQFGKLIGAWNQPSFATRTHAFLTTTEELRYTKNWTVWHYTSGWVLLQVLKNHYMWASSPQNLNDSSEVQHGLDIIDKAFHEAFERFLEHSPEHPAEIKRVKNTLKEVMDEDFFASVMDEVYYISASTSDDSLTLWRNYANGDGFALGFDPRKEISAGGLVLDPDDDDTDTREGIPQIGGWYNVHYTDQKKKKLAEKFADIAIADITNTKKNDLPVLVKELRKQTLILASTMKHKAFSDEKEVRWMTTNWTPLITVQYEHSRNTIVPVLYIKTATDDPNPIPLPIRGVRCSPVAPDGIVRTVQGLLVQQGYKQASKNVRKSEQPFKG